MNGFKGRHLRTKEERKRRQIKTEMLRDGEKERQKKKSMRVKKEKQEKIGNIREKKREGQGDREATSETWRPRDPKRES